MRFGSGMRDPGATRRAAGCRLASGNEEAPPVPIYEYECTSCGERFELLVLGLADL